MNYDLRQVAAQFQIEGQFLRADPCTCGHINDTFFGRFERGGTDVTYVHQRINQYVFKEPHKVMENISRVTAHAAGRIQASGQDPRRRVLTLVPARDGRLFTVTPDGEVWRTYEYIEGTSTYDRVEDPRHVYSAMRAFGHFQSLLSDLPGERLHETIPDFHHTPRRFEKFLDSLEKDVHNRASSAQPEIDFALAHQADCGLVVELLEKGSLPERVTHNDTKLNNVLIDNQTGEGLCVIDLDTVMPGSILYDFGDAVRVGASTALEDEHDLNKVHVDLALFEQLARGYLDASRGFLAPLEIDLLVFSARLITFEIGLRFLTDHLDGDIYFKTHRFNHNLDRCRTQFKMVAEMETRISEMEAVIKRWR